jgi:putative transposase
VEPLVEFGIARRFAWPPVSNDNPNSEPHFRSLMYWPGFPGSFASLPPAHEVSRTTFSALPG